MSLYPRTVVLYLVLTAAVYLILDQLDPSHPFKVTLASYIDRFPGFLRVFFPSYNSNSNSRLVVTATVTATTSLVLVASFFFLSHTFFPTTSSTNIPSLINRVFSSMNSNYRYRSKFGSRKSRESRFALANGGEVGGISNEGNTCFMNSVIQSLASSRQLAKFIDSYLYNEIEIDTTKEGKVVTIKTNTPKSDLVFTNALKTMLEQVNGSYGTKGKEFSTKPLLNKMPNGPKQNFFSGYNQEDAQEFYQLVMRLLEKEFKAVSGDGAPKKSASTESISDKFVDIPQVNDFVFGLHHLGKLGKVYVPAYQVEPNLSDSDKKVFPLDLITPVDGISAERIGCLTCGEVGGIRYSVTSGLSLNLPSNTSYYTSFNLNGLLDNWITPEIIEDVNCNRCGLNQTRDFLMEKVSSLEASALNSKVIEQFKERVQSINKELEQPHITDEVFEKLTIKQMIKKSRKSKQIFLSRPPPLLSIHINRSVFDPRTYSIVKNPSNVTFPATLNLGQYTAEPDDINMDARLAFRKQDGRNSLKNDSGLDTPSAHSPLISSSPSESSSTASDDLDEKNHNSETTAASSGAEDGNATLPVNPELVYNLKAVISHYGTHNYGHYICYRKYRGTWWRISDESVYVVTEEEVLTGQGTFMLFYEYNDGFKENLQDVSESEEEEEEEEEEPAKEDEDDDNSSLAAERETESESSNSYSNLNSMSQGVSSIFDTDVSDENYHAGEERVHL